MFKWYSSYGGLTFLCSTPLCFYFQNFTFTLIHNSFLKRWNITGIENWNPLSLKPSFNQSNHNYFFNPSLPDMRFFLNQSKNRPTHDFIRHVSVKYTDCLLNRDLIYNIFNWPVNLIRQKSTQIVISPILQSNNGLMLR